MYMTKESARQFAFRGFIAPASLKHDSLTFWEHNFRRFPGLHCPGLIEARHKTSNIHARKCFPGLHCPGLIEAH